MDLRWHRSMVAFFDGSIRRVRFDLEVVVESTVFDNLPAYGQKASA
jgi:hypothetical protein